MGSKKPKVTYLPWEARIVKTVLGDEFEAYYHFDNGFTFEVTWVRSPLDGWFLKAEHYFMGKLYSNSNLNYDSPAGRANFNIGFIGQNFLKVEENVLKIIDAVEKAREDYDKNVKSSSVLDIALAEIDEDLKII